MHAAAGAALVLWCINLFTSLAAVRLAWGVAILAAVALFARSVTFKCPRCGWLFGQKGRWGGSASSSTCAHCALPVGERERQTDAVDVDPAELSAQPQLRVDVEPPPAPRASSPEDIDGAEPDDPSAQPSRRAR
jgi:hypothetical protein